MSEYVFLFDLDATITKVEILPEISAEIGKDKEMRELTERAMKKLLERGDENVRN